MPKLSTLLGDIQVSKEFKYLVRLHGATLDGTKKLPYALRAVKGMGIRIAHTIIRNANLDPSLRLGNLSDAEVKRLEDVLDNPAARGLPSWMLNRRKDPNSGGDVHLLGSDLTLQLRADIDMMREIRSWKGERHARGLKVRGQKTKTAARKGRSIGVSKKQLEQRAQAPPQEQ